MPISEGCCSLSSASTPDFFPSITDAPSDPIVTSFERKVLNSITVSAKTMEHFSFSCLPKFDFGIENLWNILFQKFDMFLWMSGFQNPLVHTDFDMFVDE